jgi:hypothetical protein
MRQITRPVLGLAVLAVLAVLATCVAMLLVSIFASSSTRERVVSPPPVGPATVSQQQGQEQPAPTANPRALPAAPEAASPEARSASRIPATSPGRPSGVGRPAGIADAGPEVVSGNGASGQSCGPKPCPHP